MGATKKQDRKSTVCKQRQNILLGVTFVVFDDIIE